MEDLLLRAVERMRREGAEFCDARYQDNSDLTIRISDREVRSLADQKLAGICLRARIGGSWGYASTVSTERDELMRLAAQAVRLARSGKASGAPIPEQEALVKRVKAKVRMHPHDVPLEEKLAMARDVDLAEKVSDKVVNTNAAYVERVRNTTLVNSFGSHLEWEEVRLRMMSMAVAAESGRTEMFYDMIDGTRGMEMFAGTDVNEFGANVGREAVRTLAAIRPPSGRITCISDPSISGLLAHEVMGHASEADEVVKRRSFLTNMVGKAVASEQITMIDDGTVDGAYGSLPFDDEGTPSSRTVIIENGVYKGYMQSLETAAAMGTRSSGNGRTQDFGRRVWVRMTNTFFDAGDWTLEEMLEGVDHGILTDKSISGMEDPVGGGFEAKALRGFLIEHGRITKMVRTFALTGNALEILKTTDAVGNSIRLDGGHCGKGTEDFVPVTSGGPYCRSQIIVGGD